MKAQGKQRGRRKVCNRAVSCCPASTYNITLRCERSRCLLWIYHQQSCRNIEQNVFVCTNDYDSTSKQQFSFIPVKQLAVPLQKCILKHIRKIRRERCKTSHRMESRVLHCLFFMLLGYMPDLGLDKVISSMFFSPETDKNLMEQTTFRMTDCFAVGK